MRRSEPGAAQAPGFWIDPVNTGWQVAGLGDFDIDQRSDILWRSTGGDNVIWPAAHAPGFWIDPLNTDWQVAGIGVFAP